MAMFEVAEVCNLPPDPLRFWGLRPQTPVPFNRGYGRGLTTKPSLGGAKPSGRQPQD